MSIAQIVAIMLLNINLLNAPQIEIVNLPQNVKEEVQKPLEEEKAHDLFLEVQENSCSHGSCSLAAHNF